MNHSFKNEMAYIMCLMLPCEVQKVIACSLIQYYRRMRVKTTYLCYSINEINKNIDYMDYESDSMCYSQITLDHSRRLKNVSKQSDHIFRLFNLRLCEYNTYVNRCIRITFYSPIANANRVYVYHSDKPSLCDWKFLKVLNCLHYNQHMNYYILRPIYKNILITMNPIHVIGGYEPTVLEIMTEIANPVLSFKTDTVMKNEIEISSFIHYKLFVNEKSPIKYYQHKLYNIDIPDDGEYNRKWKNLKHYEFNDFRSKYINDLKLSKIKRIYIKKNNKHIQNIINNVNNEITGYKTTLKHTLTPYGL